MPSVDTVLVAGTPDYEENALTMAVRLAERRPGRVRLLCGDPDGTRQWVQLVMAALGVTGPGPRLVKRRPLVMCWLFLRSELVLYTHGLCLSPRPQGRRLHVNLWHGIGPKLDLSEQIIGASHLASCTGAWGRATMSALRMPEGGSLLVGNPRQDLMQAPPERAAALARLGLDPDKPVVAWLPTFRLRPSRTGRDVVDGTDLGGTASGVTLLEAVAARAVEAGVQLVLKPHPLDRGDWSCRGLRCVTSEEIWSSGTTMYQFLGLVDGLISDYSSVWVEYLVTGRPIALLCPDLDTYQLRRGFKQPDMRTVAADLLVRDPWQLGPFFHAVTDPTQTHSRAALARCREALEYVDLRDRSAALTEQLTELQPPKRASR